MESCCHPTEVQTSISDSSLDAIPDLTEDLSQQLEDIISSYHAAENPTESEEQEEASVMDVKEAGKIKNPKAEKKMLKGLGKRSASTTSIEIYF